MTSTKSTPDAWRAAALAKYPKPGPVSKAILSPRPVHDFVLPGVPSGEVALLAAPGSAGKSFWALQAAISIATGQDFCAFASIGFTPKPGKVLYISLEDTAPFVATRLHDIGTVAEALHDVATLQALDASLEIACWNHGLFDLFKMTNGINDPLPPQRPAFKLKPGEEEEDKRLSLDSILRQRSPRLVIIDTLAKSHSADENKTNEMSRVVGNLQALARRHGCAILVLHHAAKAAAMAGDMSKQQSVRGASALVDGIRCAYYMQTMTEDEAPLYDVRAEDRTRFVRWGSTKMNHGAAVDGLWYERSTGGVLSHIAMQALKKAPPAKPVPQVKTYPNGKPLNFGGDLDLDPEVGGFSV